ncbi:hypothetical protein DFJ74DRAFT_465652 [Hyaloraphidium curvatum]|nr:hypothetical protein DFJ74DRAFT_465652 [Hyaloraphidium curvatum]
MHRNGGKPTARPVVAVPRARVLGAPRLGHRVVRRHLPPLLDNILRHQNIQQRRRVARVPRVRPQLHPRQPAVRRRARRRPGERARPRGREAGCVVRAWSGCRQGGRSVQRGKERGGVAGRVVDVVRAVDVRAGGVLPPRPCGAQQNRVRGGMRGGRGRQRQEQDPEECHVWRRLSLVRPGTSIQTRPRRVGPSPAMAPKYHSIYRSNLFKDRVILVTGGGTGIGRTIAHELASLGATVVIAARRPEPLARVKAEIEAAGGRCDVVCPLDVREEGQCVEAVKRILERHGRLDGLVNNAGGQFASPAEKISAKGFRSVVDLNLTGTFLMTKAAYEGYMKDNGGSVVNVLATFKPGWYYVSHSAAARAGVANLTLSLVQEWSPHSGIRINSVVPGAVIGAGQANYPAPVQKAIQAKWHYQNPSGRLGTEAEVSAAVVFLLSPGAAYVNGVALEWVPCIAGCAGDRLTPDRIGRVDGGQSFKQGLIFPEEAVYKPESRIPMFTGFELDDEAIKGMGMTEGYEKLYRRYAEIGKKKKGADSKL